MHKPAAASSGSLLPAILLGTLAFLLFIFVGAKHTLNGINSDAAVYVLMADIYSPYRPHDISFADHLFAHYPFPPLYPLILAALGGGSLTPLLDYVIGAALLAAAVAGIWSWARRAGGSAVAAGACAVGFALTPSAWFTAMGVFSEPLYLALSMSAFALLVVPPQRAGQWYAAAALFGLAALARTVGLIAIAAFLLYWWRCTRGRHYRAVAALTLLPSLAWIIIKRLRGWHTSYTGSLFETGLRVLPDMLRQAPINLQALWYYAVRTFDVLGSTYSAVTCAMLLLLAGVGLAARLRAAAPDATYVVFYLLTMLLWPYPNHSGRLLLVILPFILAYMLWGAGLLVRRTGSALLVRTVECGVGLALACIILPSTLVMTLQIRQFAGGTDADKPRTAVWYARDSQAEARALYAFGSQVQDALTALRPHIPVHACVTSTMAEMVQLRTRRRSLRPPGIDATPAELHAALARCPYVLMLRATAFPSIEYPFYYPLTKVITHLRVLHTVPLRPPSPRGQPLAILARYVPRTAAPTDAAADGGVQ